MHFKDWKISKETVLIEDLIKNHLEKMKEFSDDFPRKGNNQKNKYGKKR